ncbi:hypothetical protein [Bradyrhizobium sp. 76]|uniref:hypothetical protein n=1 Tax=Bradyrhizobium sp. 76 TaxID=2782680 RepID=UPI001FF75C42|nr:hypothetical protein [Bradyrhizobium sp. 76]MCK1405028.1 hypothetical protein [Bradyrhizobium sp. 76]
MMWDAVGHVTTGLTLVAFMVTAGLTAYRVHLKSRIKLIEAVPPSERGGVLEKQLNAFGVEAKNLTKAQQYQIAVRELNLRSRKLLALTFVVALIAIILGLISLNAILQGDGASKRLSEYRGELTKINADIETKRNSIVGQERYRERVVRALEVYEGSIGKEGIQDHWRQNIASADRNISQFEREISDLNIRRWQVEALISKYEQCIMDKKC